jgi:hypothetical protein
MASIGTVLCSGGPMTKLFDFLDEVRAHPKWKTAVAADSRLLEEIEDVENFFADLERCPDRRVVDLHDQVARIVGAKNTSINNRLNELRTVMHAALPWIKALANQMPETKQ